ncbi:MAG: MarR family transcriptional regulator [Firmicutes bacterium]|nr:MarR family transcriptional regulator [Bacillota bacterium]
MDKYENLRIENQMCFPLYAAAKSVVGLYAPFLEPLDLTYTQYIAMMVIWEKESLSSKELGDILYLDSGTLTPLLKKLEDKGFVERKRSESDARNLIVSLTEKGRELREKAVDVPQQVGSCIKLEPAEAAELYRLLHKVLDSEKEG